MAFVLTTYQEEAARELLENTKRLLRQAADKKIVFRAPTGAGKTIMMAEFLARFADDTDHPLCAFIWAAPRQLHEQNKEKLERYFEDSRAMECSFFEDLDDRQIGENEILFFNWESIRQDDNIYIRDNEQDNNLSSVLERTRDAGREIVLIIDESHFHAQAETSQNLIGIIAPKLTIEVSATPMMQNPDKVVSVDIDEIRAEGITEKAMIKKGVSLNEDFKNVIRRGKTDVIKSELAKSTDEIVLREALKKREELAGIYSSAGTPVNPLLLIQLPDRHRQADDDREAMIVRILQDQHNITLENGKLAIYLAEHKENLENITRNDNEAEVLIFKQAIALGWDCPRAQILVLFREWSSPIFSIQTIGRIMRMPEPEKSYYDNDALNYAYAYTNIDDIVIKEDLGHNFIVMHTGKRISKYEAISLPSVHRKRDRGQTRLEPLFTRLFLEEAKGYGLKGKIKLKGQHVQTSFIADWKTENIDKIAGQRLRANVRSNAVSTEDLQRYFDYFAIRNLTPYYPEDRSVGRIKTTIYYFFNEQLGMEKDGQFENIINITLSEENRPHFKAVIDAAKLVYKAETEKRQQELVGQDWSVPDRVSFGERYTETEVKKSIMTPFFSNERWQSEKAFIDFLENPRNGVLWWFKNGERDATFFAVPYGAKDNQAPFYVDFIVVMKDGRIGLFDPHGMHLADFRAKSDGLQAYIARLKKAGLKIFGGIVANTDPRSYTGQWMVYQDDGKDAYEGDWDGWKRLEV